MSATDVGMTDGAWTKGRRLAAHPAAERLVPLLAGVCLVVLDVALVLGAFALAYWTRFVAPDSEAAALGIEQYVRMGLTVSAATVVLFALNGLYDEEHPPAWPARVQRIISAVSTALVMAVSVSFVLGDARYSRLWFACGWAFAVVGLMLWRTIANHLYAAVRDALVPANRVLIVGANPLGADLATELADRYRVVGYVDNGSDLELDATTGVPLLGAIAELEHIVQTHSVDELVVALPPERREQVDRLIARGFRRRVKVKFLPALSRSELLPARFEVHRLGGRPYVGFATAARVSWIKRATDIVLTFLGLVAISPILAAIAIAIKLDSPGPVLFRQQRVGKDGRHFAILKFRSMRQDAAAMVDQLRDRNEAIGPLFKIRADPRVTRVGKVLRRLSLDELPQLLNVLRGDMSLVGPRPPLPSEVAAYEDWQFGRLRTVPGITGLWQVSGRSEVPFHDMVRLDIHYIRNWSLGLDLEILARTVPAVLSSRGAY